MSPSEGVAETATGALGRADLVEAEVGEPKIAAGAAPEASGRSERGRYLGLVALFLAMGLALSVFRLPRVAAWQSVAFQDAGANLTVDYLTRHGDRPGVDNGYIYGLLCLGFGQLWCGMFGLTPYASLAAWALGNLVLAWGMARFAYHARVGPAGVALMLVGMNVCNDQTFVYILEPILLAHALAEQARGRRAAALALTTGCAFVKPSMASTYGLILLATILTGRPGPPRFRDRLRQLLPATAVGVALLLVLGGVYGVPALVRSLVPVHAAAIYKASGFGFFFGRGSSFWYFPGVGKGYYIGTPAGFWLLGTILLVVGAISGVVAQRKDGPPRNRDIVATCAVLHLVFVCFFFAHPFSYKYYYFVLTFGLAALAPRSRGWAAAVLALAAVGLVGNRADALSNINEWRAARRDPGMFGFFARPAEAEEWREVRRRIEGRRAATLAVSDGAALIVPELYPPTIYYMAPTELTPLETGRKLEQLRSAEAVVEVADVIARWPSNQYPVFQSALEGAERVFEGKIYRVYARRGATARGARVEPEPIRP
jgi:hypothetical protein